MIGISEEGETVAVADGEVVAGNDAKKGGKGPKVKVGKLAKTDKKKPAELKEGEKTEPRFRPDIYAEDRLGGWWKNGSNTYYVQQPGGGRDLWLELNSKQLEEELMSYGLSDESDKRTGGLSETAQVALYLRRNRRVEMQANVAGYDAGVYMMGDTRVLVRKSARWIEPIEGKWDTLDQILNGILVRRIDDGEMPRNFLGYMDSEPGMGRDRGRAKARAVWKELVRELDGDGGWVMDQRVIFFAWLKTRLEVYLTHKKDGEALHRNGQALVLAGPQNSGKSLLQELVLTPLLGGRIGDPSDVLFGRSNFNLDLFAAEHLCLQEMPAKVKTEDRMLFGEMLKAYVTSGGHRLHGKGKDGVMLRPVWTWTISVNDDPDRLRAFPPMTADLAGKVQMLHACSTALPFDTTDHGAYLEFGRLIHSELPGFLHWLFNVFEMPKVLRDGRFGLVAFQAPELVQNLFEDTPAGSLMELIDDSRFGAEVLTTLWEETSDVKPAWVRKRFASMAGLTDAQIRERCWSGSAAALQKILEDENNSLFRSARDCFKFNRAPRLLGRLATDEPGRVAYDRRNGARNWCIVREIASAEEPVADGADEVDAF